VVSCFVANRGVVVSHLQLERATLARAPVNDRLVDVVDRVAHHAQKLSVGLRGQLTFPDARLRRPHQPFREAHRSMERHEGQLQVIGATQIPDEAVLLYRQFEPQPSLLIPTQSPVGTPNERGNEMLSVSRREAPTDRDRDYVVRGERAV
jgi:hypothetical protein